MNKIIAILFFAFSMPALSADTLIKWYLVDRATLGDSCFVGGVDKPFTAFGVHGVSAIADTFYEVNYTGRYGYFKFTLTDVGEMQAMDDLIAAGYAQTLQVIKIYTQPNGNTDMVTTPFIDLPVDYFPPENIE